MSEMKTFKTALKSAEVTEKIVRYSESSSQRGSRCQTNLQWQLPRLLKALKKKFKIMKVRDKGYSRCRMSTV